MFAESADRPLGDGRKARVFIGGDVCPIDHIPTPRFWARLLNTVQCESHREALEGILEDQLSAATPKRRPSP